jgi:hypothetical protein
MTAPNSTYSNDLLSVTVQELEDELFDQISRKNAMTALLKEEGSIRYVDGGPTIVIPVMYAENGSYKRYSGADVLNTSSNDVFSAFSYPWCQIAINIQANGRELLQNMGRSQNRDLIKSRIMNAKASFENNFNIDILSDGSSANQIGGAKLLMDPAGAGTVGGVARASFSFAANQYYRATTDGGTAASATNIVTYMDAMDVLLQTYKANTKAILADNAFYKFYESAVHPLQRITNTDGALARLGFRTYQYKNAEVVFEPTGGGMAASTMFWLDPEVLELVVHSSRNLVRLPKRDSFNQDSQIEYMAWMGQLTAKNFRRLGNLNNT